jgi:hypothetical protein
VAHYRSVLDLYATTVYTSTVSAKAELPVIARWRTPSTQHVTMLY